MFTTSLLRTRSCVSFSLKRQFSRSASSNVKVLTSHKEYEDFVSGKNNNKAIVYFTAKWCGPCKMISPIYDELSISNDDISFAKVDVDELEETAMKCSIRSMPTFHFHANGSSIQELKFSGADPNMLSTGVAELKKLK